MIIDSWIGSVRRSLLQQSISDNTDDSNRNGIILITDKTYQSIILSKSDNDDNVINEYKISDIKNVTLSFAQEAVKFVIDKKQYDELIFSNKELYYDSDRWSFNHNNHRGRSYDVLLTITFNNNVKSVYNILRFKLFARNKQKNIKNIHDDTLVNKVPGIGNLYGSRLNKLGIKTFGDLKSQPPAMLNVLTNGIKRDKGKIDLLYIINKYRNTKHNDQTVMHEKSRSIFYRRNKVINKNSGMVNISLLLNPSSVLQLSRVNSEFTNPDLK